MAEADPKAKPRSRVLIIDDEATITNALRRHLQADHDVTLQNDPLAALSMLREGARFDVILCDMMMPKMNGAQLHRALLAIDPAQARVMILMTGGSVPRDAIELLATGSVPNLNKPFDVEQLRALIRTLPTSS